MQSAVMWLLAASVLLSLKSISSWTTNPTTHLAAFHPTAGRVSLDVRGSQRRNHFCVNCRLNSQARPTKSQPPRLVIRPSAVEGLERTLEKSVDGSHLLASPHTHSFTPNGDLKLKLPLLGRREEIELAVHAKFFLNVTEGRRVLMDGCGSQLPSHTEVLSFIGYNTSITDTEFRVQESKGRAAYNKLFSHNLGLIYKEVNKYKDVGIMERSDLWQEGAMGLLRAITLFDPSMGIKLCTYATWHIKAHVLRLLRDKSHTMRLPQSLQQDIQQLRNARRRFALENQGQMASADNLCSMLGWEGERLARAQRGIARKNLVSLDASETTGFTGHDRIHLTGATPAAQCAENQLFLEQFKTALKDTQALRKQPDGPENDTSRRLLWMRYGLVDGREWTHKQLAERFDMTPKAVARVVRQELSFLRRHQSKLKTFTSMAD